MLELKTVLWIPFSYRSKDKWCQVRCEICGGEKKKILALRSAIIEETTVPRITLSVVLMLPILCEKCSVKKYFPRFLTWGFKTMFYL